MEGTLEFLMRVQGRLIYACSAAQSLLNLFGVYHILTFTQEAWIFPQIM